MTTQQVEQDRTGKAWGQIDRLLAELIELLYAREDRSAARRVAAKLRPLIGEHDPMCLTVVGAAARSVMAELDCDWWNAIRAREREIDLLKQLQGNNVPAPVRTTPDDLSDRLDLLAGLYWQAGELAKAENVLLQSKKLCEKSGIAFDGRSMLAELRRERRAPGRGKSSATRRAS